MADYIFYVKVANSKFVLDSVSQATIALGHDITYRFDQSDSTNAGNTIAFSTTSDGTHNSGSAYTTGVTTTGTAGSSGAYVDIAVTSSTPASLYYYSAGNSGYGSAVITTGNTHVTTNNLGLLLPILADATDQWGSHINQSLRKIEDTFGANADVYTYNITGDTTAITGSATAGGTLAFNDGQHIEVYLNGVKLVGNLSSGNDYTLNASTDTITLASNAVNGDVVNVVVFKTFQFADAVPASTGGTFSGNVTVPNLIIGDGGNIGSASDTDALTIDSSGNVGIGGSPAARLHVETSGNTGIQIRSGTTTSNGFINFNDGATAKGQIFYDHNGDYMRLYVNSAERMRIHSGGNVELKTTNANLILPSGGGIDFGNQTNTGSSISNQVLEHYERGIFTPTIFTASNSNFAGSGTSGVYLRIGEWITVGMIIQNISWPTSNTSESVSVGGLPFASGEDALGYGWSNIVAYTNTDMNNTLALTTGTSSTVGRFRFSTSTNTNATIADFNTYSSPTRIDLSLSYLAT